MEAFVLAAIPEIAFGAGKLGEIGARATALGGANAPVMMVADPALRALGITDRAVALLAEAGHPVSVFDALKGEPKAADIDGAAKMARDAKARLVVGLGGGSALDTAKLVAACAASGRPAEHYALGVNPLPADCLPTIAVPTTAGTGSEVTRTSVFANGTGGKVWAWGDALKPKAAILDPELTVGVPPAVTAATGLDALVHAIEASTNRNRHDANDLYCHRAIGLIARHLERAVANPADLAARGALLLGSCYAGIGIDNCGTALAHCVSHALADLAPIPHGRATGLAMLATIAWTAEGNPPAFTAVARAMGADDAIEGYDRLLRASGLKVSLIGDGLELNRPDLLASHMASAANAPMRRSTAREIRDTDLLPLAQMVYALS